MNRIFAAVIILLALTLATGCRSAYVEATVHNGTGAAVTLLEVDYPSASFGKDELASGADFRYRFKILGTGGTKVVWTDAMRHEHTVVGPELREGQEGSVTISLSQNTADWKLALQPIR